MFIKKKITTKFQSMIEITDEIRGIIDESGVESGFCHISVPHTTAGLLITSFWDSKGHEDIQDDIERMIPTRVDFKHRETAADASGHVKSAIVGTQLSIIIDKGKLLLGHSQGIMFAEFDGPRPREYYVKVYAD